MRRRPPGRSRIERRALDVERWTFSPPISHIEMCRNMVRVQPRQMAQTRRQALNSPLQEVFGLTLLVFGVLLLLALISYTPRDVPAWFPLSHFDKPNRATQNFVGSLGAIMACASY